MADLAIQPPVLWQVLAARMGSPRPGNPAAMTQQQAEAHEHDWTLINRDENRLIYKCLGCGELRKE